VQQGPVKQFHVFGAQSIALALYASDGIALKVNFTYKSFLIMQCQFHTNPFFRPKSLCKIPSLDRMYRFNFLVTKKQVICFNSLEVLLELPKELAHKVTVAWAAKIG